MKLAEKPFWKIAKGFKTVELRLYDEKRAQIRPGDLIRFVLMDDKTQWVETSVKALYIFKSFKELYANIPLEKCGYTEDEIHDDCYLDMRTYYSEDDEKKYGVVGIEIELV